MSIEAALRSLGDEPTDIDITIATPARMRKKDNPFPHAVKVQTLRCSVNFDYEKEMSKEHGGWVAEQRSWGGHVMGTCLIDHQDVFYVQVLVHEASDPFYAVDGQRVPTELLKPFLQSSNPSKVRDIKLSNIVSLGIGDKVVIAVGHASTIPA